MIFFSAFTTESCYSGQYSNDCNEMRNETGNLKIGVKRLQSIQLAETDVVIPVKNYGFLNLAISGFL
jgi:hypothetical protein